MPNEMAIRVAALFVFLTTGCGAPVVSDLVEFTDLHPVTGKASYKGQPMAGGSIRLFPVNSVSGGVAADVHTAVVSEDGSFEVQTFRSNGRGTGVPSGDYSICLSWTGLPDEKADVSRDDLPEKLPVKYTRPQSSGLRVTVAPGGTVLQDIELK